MDSAVEDKICDLYDLYVQVFCKFNINTLHLSYFEQFLIHILFVPGYG